MDELTNNDRKKEITEAAMSIELLPTAEKRFLNLPTGFRIDKGSLGSAGTNLGSLVNVLSQITSAGGEGLYKVSFPNGVSGTLQRASKDGKLIGSIMDGGKITGQARLTPVSIDPTQLVIAATLAQVNMKLDALQKGQEDIIHFIEQDKKSQLLTDCNNLADIYSTYRYNSDNSVFIGAKINLIQNIKREADKNIDFYKNRLENSMQKSNSLHVGSQAKDLLNRSIENLNYYKLALYNYSFSTFIEVMFLQNFNSEYLEKISQSIEQKAYDFREIYTQCYNFLENYTNNSLDTWLIKGTGKVSRKIGNAIANNAVLSKGPVDEALIGAGNKIDRLTKADFKHSMAKLAESKDHGVREFIESIHLIDRMYNKPLTMIVNDNEVFMIA